MDSIYQVTAKFDYGESIEYISIGNFSDIEKANLYKEKWDQFFKSNKKIFQEPDNWDPSNDPWVNQDYNPQWVDSEGYYILLSKYDDIFAFSDIEINKIDINDESFMLNWNYESPTKSLMIQFDRDWKLNQIQ